MSMPTTLFDIVIAVAAAGSGLIAGLFFVFSMAVMPSLAAMPTSQGIRMMQLINRKIINFVFLLAFVGTAIVCLVVIGLAIWQWFTNIIAIIGALLYLVGGFGITAAFNVPLNTVLESVDPVAPSSEAVWQDYVQRWTRWNHLRTAVSLLAALLLALV